MLELCFYYGNAPSIRIYDEPIHLAPLVITLAVAVVEPHGGNVSGIPTVELLMHPLFVENSLCPLTSASLRYYEWWGFCLHSDEA